MKTKGFIVAAVILIAVGLILFCVAAAQCQGDLSKLSTGGYETTVHSLSDSFLHFDIDTDTADIRLVPSIDGNCRVECYEQAKMRHDVSVQSDTLVIQMEDRRAWYDYIGFHLESPIIRIYLPLEQYGALSISASTGDITIPEEFTFESIDVNISTGDIYCSASATGRIHERTSTGDIRMENSSAQSVELFTDTGAMLLTNVSCAEELNLNVTTGDTQITNTTCTYFSSTGDTGDLHMQSLHASHSTDIERSTGDVIFDLLSCPNVVITTDTGDVEGRLVSNAIFDVESNTGHIDIPPSRLYGKCKIRTDTGDVKITVYHPIFNP